DTVTFVWLVSGNQPCWFGGCTHHCNARYCVLAGLTLNKHYMTDDCAGQQRLEHALAIMCLVVAVQQEYVFTRYHESRCSSKLSANGTQCKFCVNLNSRS